MVLPPDWAGSCTVGSFVGHYATVAKHIPVMVVINASARSHDLGLQVLKVLREEVDNVVAVKDDLSGTFAREPTLLANERIPVLSGGKPAGRRRTIWPSSRMAAKVTSRSSSTSAKRHLGILACH